MTDYGDIKLSGSSYGELSRSFTAACRRLPRDVARRLCIIKDSYFAKYGFEGVFERMNNRTVAQVFAEHQPAESVKPIASGEIDGTRYALYDAPNPPAAEGGGKKDNMDSQI